MKYIICHAEKKIMYMTLFNSVEDAIFFLHSQHEYVYFKCFPRYRNSLAWYKTKLYFVSSTFILNNVKVENNSIMIYGVPEHGEKEI